MQIPYFKEYLRIEILINASCCYLTRKLSASGFFEENIKKRFEEIFKICH